MKTSFEMICLCYRFGLRARAMMYTLSQNRGDVDVSVRVFAARSQDVDMMTEGNSAGKNPVRLDFTMIPESDILKRAAHYHAYEPADCSHVIYGDCDLWFPKGFWASYRDAIEKEAPGYWSCNVVNVDEPKPDIVTGNYQNVRADLMGYKKRYDEYAGRVGHFQCIPRGLEKYPFADKHSVEGSDLTFSNRCLAKSADKREDRRIGGISAYHLCHPASWAGAPCEL